MALKVHQRIELHYQHWDNVVLFRIISKNIDILEISINKILKKYTCEKDFKLAPLCDLLSFFFILHRRLKRTNSVQVKELQKRGDWTLVPSKTDTPIPRKEDGKGENLSHNFPTRDPDRGPLKHRV